ncbi:MAG: hypothetical protein OEY01_09565 [Desulfobulbaceae bacterium]|nr:hypothetical protein [Desulfobulbaceae bacterium]HIJ79251.1 hypothetical protein [Deltaproteobacteria bacterium]
MKINDIYPGQQGLGKTDTKANKAGATKFDDLLRNEMQSLTQSEKTEPTAQVSPVPNQTPAGLRTEGLTMSESTIDTLDSFSAALADPRFSARDLEPYAAALEDDTAALIEMKKQLPIDDPLAALLDRVATISYLEAAKFRRGDYTA